MAWWILELIVTGVLLAIVLVLGPLIRRFGRSYAADVFRANPRTGKSYLVLMDIAYYLVFVAFVLLTTTVDPPWPWLVQPGHDLLRAGVLEQLEHIALRTGGLLGLMGVLHRLTIAALPLPGLIFADAMRHLPPSVRAAGHGDGRHPRQA